MDVILSTILETTGYDKDRWEAERKRRTPEPLLVKQLFSLLAYEEGYTTPKIGHFLELNTATVHHHINQARGLAMYEQDYGKMVQGLKNILGEAKKIQKEATVRGWVARDEDGELALFADKPEIDEFSTGGHFWVGEAPRTLPSKSFPQITWETGAEECEITIRLK